MEEYKVLYAYHSDMVKELKRRKNEKPKPIKGTIIKQDLNRK